MKIFIIQLWFSNKGRKSPKNFNKRIFQGNNETRNKTFEAPIPDVRIIILRKIGQSNGREQEQVKL